MARIRNSLTVLALTVTFMQCDAVSSADISEPVHGLSLTVPAGVTDLAAINPTDSSVTLTFTEVDDGTKHPANYDIRYALAPLTWGNTVSITSDCANPIIGTVIGARRACVVRGLTGSTRYDFQLVPYRGTLDTDAAMGPLSAVATTTTQPAVASVVVSPSSASVMAGDTLQLTATTLDANGTELGRPVQWSSADTTVATVDTRGMVTAIKPGSVVTSARYEGAAGQALITVTPSVAKLVVAPTPLSLTVGQSAKLTATLLDANGHVVTGQTTTWSSTASSVASVDATGSVLAVSPGNATIVATSAGETGQAQVTVSAAAPPPVARVTVAPSTVSLTTGQTSQLSVTLRDASGFVLTGRTVTWASSAPGVAQVTASGLITAVAAGNATVVATSEGKTGQATVSISNPIVPVATVTIAPSSVNLTVTQTSQLGVTLRDANGNVLTGRSITWVSGNPGVAQVNASGLITAIGGGSATITATSESKTGQAQVTVSAPVATVGISPTSTSLLVGQTSQLGVALRDAGGNLLTGRTVTWSSNATGVAQVSGSGLVTAVAAGSATITVTSESKTGQAQVTVTTPPAPVASVTVSPANLSLAAGQSTPLSVTLRDAASNVLTGRTLAWASDASSVASVNGTGLVTANSSGSANIYVTSEGQTGQSSITVSPASGGGSTFRAAWLANWQTANLGTALADVQDHGKFNGELCDKPILAVANHNGRRVLQATYNGTSDCHMVTASNQYPAPTPGSGVRYLTYGFTHEAGFIDGNNLGQPHPFQVSAAPGGPYLFFFMSGPASGGQQLVEIEFPQATDFRLTRFGLFLPTNKRLTFNIQLDYYTPGACKVRPYIWDADTGVLLYGPANWTDRNRDPAHTLATDNPDLVVPGSNVAYFRTFELGQNGPFPSSTGLEYWENVWTYLSADPADLPGVKTGT